MQSITLLDQILYLLPEKAIWWPQQSCLILSDTHFGKSGHFRKMGIAIPQTVFSEDMQRFVTLVAKYKVTTVIIVGDMFHSQYNKEADLFLRWRNDFASVHIHLIKGNHDIMPARWYADANIEVHHEQIFHLPPFSFIHDMNDVSMEQQNGKYFISGHLHPAISVKGKARQKLILPCFYFSINYAVLPAFGKFTGFVALPTKLQDQVFAIAQQTVFKI